MTDNQFKTGKTSNVSEQAAREAERLKNQAKSAMHSAAEQAKEQGRQAAEQAMDRVGQETEKLANAERAAARQLRQDNFPTLARYMEQVADGITGFADQMRHKKIDEIVNDISDFGRKNPALFIAGSVVLGAALMRFAKSSDRGEEDDRSGRVPSSSYGETSLRSSLNERTTLPQPNGAMASARTTRPDVDRATSSVTSGSAVTNSAVTNSATTNSATTTTSSLGSGSTTTRPTTSRPTASGSTTSGSTTSGSGTQGSSKPTSRTPQY